MKIGMYIYIYFIIYVFIDSKVSISTVRPHTLMHRILPTIPPKVELKDSVIQCLLDLTRITRKVPELSLQSTEFHFA